MNSRNKFSTNNKESKKKSYEVNSKVDSCLITMRSLRELAEKEAKLVQEALKDMENNLIDPGYILDLTKSIHTSGNKNVTDYINRNTEILMNEHSSVVRQKVIQKMKQQIQDMNADMSKEAQKLGQDISNFFEFIQRNYEEASLSFKKVLELAKSNYAKFEQVNEMENQLFLRRSELQELEQELLECLMCYAFLEAITSQETTTKGNLPQEFLRSFGPKTSTENFDEIQKNVLEDVLEEQIIILPTECKVESSDITKLLDHFKESNLTLVYTACPLPWITHKKENHSSLQKMEEELKEWDEKISNAQEENEKAAETLQNLQNAISNLSDEETEKVKLQRQTELRLITEVYKLCTGSSVTYMDIALMRVAIDNAMEKLFSELDDFPKRKVKELLKMLDAEKKLSERKAEEALRAQRATNKKQIRKDRKR